MEVLFTQMEEAVKVLKIFINPQVLFPSLILGLFTGLLAMICGFYEHRKDMEKTTHDHDDTPNPEGIDIQIYPRLTPFQTIDNLLTAEEKAFLRGPVGSIACPSCGHLMVFHYTKGDCKICTCSANKDVIGG